MTQVGEPCERIAVNHDEIRDLALFKGAELILEPEGERAAGRREPKGLIVRQPRRRKQLELIVHAESVRNRRGVTTDRNAPARADEASNRLLESR
jgi:hypothetical protein